MGGLYIWRKLLAVLFVLFLLLPLEVEGAVVAQRVRYSNSPDRVRIVVDLNEPLSFKEQEGFAGRVVLDLGVASLGKDVKDVIVSDKVVRQAKLFVVEKNKLLLDVLLEQETQYKAFLLKDPWRLVIDIMKNYDIQEDVVVAPGLTYVLQRKLQNGNPLRIHSLTVDVSKWDIKPVLANNQVLGREKLKDIALANKAAAVVNASYFGSDGWVIGNLKIDGQIVGCELLSRTAMLIYPSRQVEFSALNYQGQVVLPDGLSLPIRGVNRERLNDDLVLYESNYAKSTNTNEYGIEVGFDVKGSVLFVNRAGNSTLSKGQFVLSGHGQMAEQLAFLQVGDKLLFEQSLGAQADKARHVLGAGPRLLKAGRIAISDQEEQFPADITRGRAPRTAVGVTSDRKVILLVADGRSKSSQGLTLLELAELMLAKGAVEAMNLDGGGSSEMVIGQQIMNAPSDQQERRVSVGLGVFSR